MMVGGPTWHGTAIGWKLMIDRYITRIPIISERFSGVKYMDGQTNMIIYSVYLPMCGQDEDYLEVLSLLSSEITELKTAVFLLA